MPMVTENDGVCSAAIVYSMHALMGLYYFLPICRFREVAKGAVGQRKKLVLYLPGRCWPNGSLDACIQIVALQASSRLLDQCARSLVGVVLYPTGNLAARGTNAATANRPHICLTRTCDRLRATSFITSFPIHQTNPQDSISFSHPVRSLSRPIYPHEVTSHTGRLPSYVRLRSTTPQLALEQIIGGCYDEQRKQRSS
jgi:hypothetical protein